MAYRLDDLDDKAWVTPLSYDHDFGEDPQAVLDDFNRGLDEAVEEGFLALDGSRPEPLDEVPNSSGLSSPQVTIEKLVGKH